MKKFILVFVVAVIGILILSTTPSKEEHLKKINENICLLMMRARFNVNVSEQTKADINKTLEKFVEYHNYIIYSSCSCGELELSKGYLGNVYVDDEMVEAVFGSAIK